MALAVMFPSLSTVAMLEDAVEKTVNVGARDNEDLSAYISLGKSWTD